MTRRPSHTAQRATDREVSVVAAVLVAGSEKAAAHRLGLSHSTVKHHLARARSKVGAATTAQLVWILAPRLPVPRGDESTRPVAPGTGLDSSWAGEFDTDGGRVAPAQVRAAFLSALVSASSARK
jgi:DNA-binding CsgD family transcriptional regulator